MKYDRPVWQLMYQCAAAMPEVFRYDDVHDWFGRHYPEVGQATLRAHLVGLSEGGRAKQPQFAQRSPVFRRVTRGTYEVIPAAERTIDPDLTQSDRVALGLEQERGKPGPLDDPFAAAAFDDAVTVAARRSEESHDTAAPSVLGEPEPVDAEAPRGARTSSEAGHVADPHDDPEVWAQLDDTVEEVEPALEVEPPDDDLDFEALLARAGLALGKPPQGLSLDRDAIVSGLPTDAALIEDGDVVLVAGDGEQVLVPAPAREVYRGDDFQTARILAERAGVAWFVLSSEHGLLSPDEWMSPDSRQLADLEPQHRFAWAHFVVARLQSIEGPVAGRTVHLTVPPSHVGPLSAALQDAGAVVSTSGGELVARVVTFSEARLESPEPAASPGPTEAAPPSRTSPPPEMAPTAVRTGIATVPGRSGHRAEDVARWLADPVSAVAAAEARDLPESPGLYAWHVDADGARQLNRSLQLPVGAGPIFVGQVGAREAWRADPVADLRHLLSEIHLGGRTRASTFRTTLATALTGPLRLRTFDDPELVRWMMRHLSVVVWPSDDRNALRDLLQRVTGILDPRLNVDHPQASEVRHRLAVLRADLA